MKIGKIPENVLKRSVLRQFHTKRDEVLLGAGVGEDCAGIELSEDEVFVVSTDPITGTSKDIGGLSVIVTINDLASAGAEPIGIMLTILLPEQNEEKELKAMVQQVEAECEKFHIQVLGGHTEVTDAVTRPIFSVTGIGKVKKGRIVSTAGVRPGMDIIATKWVGIEGTVILVREREKELLERYSTTFIDRAKDLDAYICVLSEAAVAARSGVSAMHDVTEGGIFGALWEMAEASGVGLEIDLKKIPIRQETVEICEFFGLNPYELISSGCMLMAASDGNYLVRELEKEGIPAVVIGKATEGNDRILLNEEETRFLEPPKTDELYKVM
ncbi:MAG: AIR synthase family protein [Lachnospiraceae bacterium]|nr:AIR synthase family protein [Lachnospiraceae bacterium]